MACFLVQLFIYLFLFYDYVCFAHTYVYMPLACLEPTEARRKYLMSYNWCYRRL